MQVAEMKAILNFSSKWRAKFQDEKIKYKSLLDQSMADECSALAFKISSGDEFIKKYGHDVNNYGGLKKIIHEIKDIQLLGSAIYSKWAYFRYWADDSSEILSKENRLWFVLALKQLEKLSGDEVFACKNDIKKVRIISSNISFERMPDPEEEVEQRLSINSEGSVYFSAYKFGSVEKPYPKKQSKIFKIEKETSSKLLSALAAYFHERYDKTFTPDIGSWEIEITDRDGKVYKYYGSLDAKLEYEGIDLSDFLRDSLGMDDLYAFDGNYKSSIIDKITVDYHRITKMKIEGPNEEEAQTFEWGYREAIIIDRKSQSLEHIRKITDDWKVYNIYQIKDKIDLILDRFNGKELFSEVEGNPDDLVEDPNGRKEYNITIEYRKGPQKIIQGSYDKRGLPKDFENFAIRIFSFIKIYILGEILDPAIYGKIKRRKSEYIFCSVKFKEGYKSYYYLTDDDEIEVGDFVLVPAGKDNHEEVVKVVKIEYYTKENAPLAVKKTKKIIKKLSGGD